MRTIDNRMKNSRAHDTNAIREYIHNARTHNMREQDRTTHTTNRITAQHSTAQYNTAIQKCMSQSQEKLQKQEQKHNT